jgi:hypothetical protein
VAVEWYRINNYFVVAAGVQECGIEESLVLESFSRAHNLSANEDL